MEKGMRWFLICLTAYFVVVHLSGILQLYQLSVPLWIHIVFFIVDSLVVVGLVKKTKWGYFLAVVLCFHQVIVQTYWSFFSGIALESLGIRQSFLLVIVTFALAILLIKKDIFLNPKG